jgi:hypothetical protein
LEGRGFAGGEKYLQRGIYFKFAVDSHRIYQDEESIAKVAGHELKSLNQLFGLWIKDVHFPMMILIGECSYYGYSNFIDYRGFRLIAMSTLPINENTIVYGSSDAGVTIHTDNSKAIERMRAIADKLNLKEHKVGPKYLEKLVSTPVDLEAHYGFDNRYYLLGKVITICDWLIPIDFSRTFPPTTPDRTVPSSYLFKLLRPEFVKNYHKPLCSDSFSNFVKNYNADEHNKEIEEATKYLRNVIIPNFAKELALVKVLLVHF